MNMYTHIEKGFTDYDNWRYMENDRTDYTGGQIDERRLLVLLGNYYLVSFPYITILKYINLAEERKGVVMAAEGRYPEYCKRCYGAGKFDWVSNITGPNHLQSRYEFIRDKSVVLLYHKPNGEISKNHVWAPTEVCEGEHICDYCLGTGIDLGARYCFQSELKKSLVLYDIRYLLT